MSDRNGSRPSVDERLCCNIRISQGDLQCFGTVFIALSEAKERAVRAMRQGRCKRCLSFSEAASSQWKFHNVLRKQTMFVMLMQRVNAAEQYLYVHARVLVATVNSGNRPQDASANAFELASGTRPGLTRACAVEVDLSMNRSTTPRLSNIFYRLQQQRVVTGSKHAYIHGDVKHPPSTNQPSRWGRASTYHMY
jgi:hypothetical protein